MPCLACGLQSQTLSADVFNGEARLIVEWQTAVVVVVAVRSKPDRRAPFRLLPSHHVGSHPGCAISVALVETSGAQSSREDY